MRGGGILCLLAQLYWYVFILRIILSWVPSLPEPLLPIARGLYAVTDPLLRPLRGKIPPLRLGSGLALDLSPLIVLFALGFVVIPLICAYSPI
jgi:YggT family protein